MKKYTQGFTLIELLVVISIIGVLAALLLANMVSIRQRANDSKTKSNLAQLKSALRLYYNEHQAYPQDNNSDPCDTRLNPVLGEFISSTAIPVGQYACRYKASNNLDTFVACAPLQLNAGTDDDNSRSACGITDIQTQMGATTNNIEDWYCVCSQ